MIVFSWASICLVPIISLMSSCVWFISDNIFMCVFFAMNVSNVLCYYFDFYVPRNLFRYAIMSITLVDIGNWVK